MLYYNNNYGLKDDEYAIVHQGTAVNFNLAGDYADSFHNALMFSGKVSYLADLTPPAPQCSVNADCDDNIFCNGLETCSGGTCQSGTAPSCSGSSPFCSEDLDQCVACLANSDCADEDLCNGAETCNASGQCIAGTSVDCDDGVACTVSISFVL